MPVLPPGPIGGISVPPTPATVQQVCTNALYEINVVAPGEMPDPLELAFVLDKFNQIVDSWNTQKVYIFASDLLSANPTTGVPFLLVPGLAPHTIGPSWAGAPTYETIAERPVRLKNVNILLNNVVPVVRFPLQERDKDWWATNRLQPIQTSLPTDFYYRPDWPLGSIFFWPVPNFAYGAEFEIETIIQGASKLATTFAAPPGYELAITLTLAELLCPAFEKQMNPVLMNAAMMARRAVQGLNAGPPRINLDDFGSSGGGRPRATFNYHTGLSI